MRNLGFFYFHQHLYFNSYVLGCQKACNPLLQIVQLPRPPQKKSCVKKPTGMNPADDFNIMSTDEGTRTETEQSLLAFLVCKH